MSPHQAPCASLTTGQGPQPLQPPAQSCSSHRPQGSSSTWPRPRSRRPSPAPLQAPPRGLPPGGGCMAPSRGPHPHPTAPSPGTPPLITRCALDPKAHRVPGRWWRSCAQTGWLRGQRVNAGHDTQRHLGAAGLSATGQYATGQYGGQTGDGPQSQLYQQLQIRLQVGGHPMSRPRSGLFLLLSQAQQEGKRPLPEPFCHHQPNTPG